MSPRLGAILCAGSPEHITFDMFISDHLNVRNYMRIMKRSWQAALSINSQFSETIAIVWKIQFLVFLQKVELCLQSRHLLPGTKNPKSQEPAFTSLNSLLRLLSISDCYSVFSFLLSANIDKISNGKPRCCFFVVVHCALTQKPFSSFKTGSWNLESLRYFGWSCNLEDQFNATHVCAPSLKLQQRNSLSNT